VDFIFEDPANFKGSTLVLGAVFFTIQVYGDFSGYSDIAIGTARIFGFNLKANFRFPFFSRDMGEFWRRWHISLTTWFRDYLYIPLGGNRQGTNKNIRNVFVIFIVSGLWHGASWKFIFWGAINAFYLLPNILIKKWPKNLSVVAKGRVLPSFKEIIQMVITFGLVMLSFVFFRAENINQAFVYMHTMFSESVTDGIQISKSNNAFLPPLIGILLNKPLIDKF